MSFYKTTTKVLLTAQVFGFMPVNGVSDSNIINLNFSWKSWKMFYSALTLAGMLFMTCVQIRDILSNKCDMVDIYKLISYITATCTAILFIRLAKEWPQFMKTWNTIDKSMATYGWPPNLNRKVNGILIIFLALLLLRYIFTQLHQVIGASQCISTNDDSGIFTHFLKRKYGNVYKQFTYEPFSSVLLLYSNIQIIFSHTFLDVFIMVVSQLLAARIKQVTKRIEAVVTAEVKEEHVWIQLREDYNRLELFCNTVNSDISYLIVLSFVRNLAMILILLFLGLKVRERLTEKLYFYYVFGFLLIRTTFVCILGSAVNDESRKPLPFLYAVSDLVYSLEIDRFIRQIAMNSMALSGLNLFLIKRDIVLKIAGALVTYELILIQFAGSFLKPDNDKISC